MGDFRDVALHRLQSLLADDKRLARRFDSLVNARRDYQLYIINVIGMVAA